MRRLFLLVLVGLIVLGLFAVSLGHRRDLNAQQTSGLVASSHEITRPFSGSGDWDETITLVKLTPKPMTIIEAKVWLKLQEKITLDFPAETPLDEFVKFIRMSTVDKVDFPDGLPIYIDPSGLKDSDAQQKSPIQISLKGIPLATTLKLALKQLNLAYWVNPDGLLIITNPAQEDIPIDSDALIRQELASLRREVRSLRTMIQDARGAGVSTREAPTPAKPQQPNPVSGGVR